MSEYRLFSWGANSHGQLGQGDIEAEELLVPNQVDLSSAKLRAEDIVKIVGGAGHTLLLDKSGHTHGCGWNNKGQVGLAEATSRFQRLDGLEGRKIVDVACGWDSSMALADDGKIFVWGSNSHGQLGSRTIKLGSWTSKPLAVELDVPVQRISMGLRHTAVVTRDSKVFICGAAAKGQLGIGSCDDRCYDVFVEVPNLHNVDNVACGQHHTIAVTKSNEIFAWGDNKHSQLGIDFTLHKAALTPMKVENSANAGPSSRIYCGWTHSAVLTSDKQIFAWGRNSYGQLGRAKTTPTTELWKGNVPTTLEKIKQLSLGSEHNIALRDDGAVFSWGWNEHGNCGNGSTENLFAPTKVTLPDSSGILVGTGAGHSFAVVKANF